MDYVLTTKGLQKKYGHFTALNNVSIHVPKGAIYGLTGKNGAGKTTLLRVVCGLQEPTEGTYTLFGRQNTQKDIAKSRRRMGAVVEMPAFYPNMTAEENVKMQYRILGLPSYEGIPELLRMVGLDHDERKTAGKFSLGMRQRLGIALALAGSPDFLILDEPINGLDPQGIVELRELILRLNRERQVTFLISGHILDEISRMATWYGFIDQGCILQEISADELEHSCGTWIHITVSDIRAFCTVLEEKGLEYRVVSDTEARIYSQVGITELVQALAARECMVLSIHEHEEGLEHYYMNLVAGNSDISSRSSSCRQDII